MLVGYSIGSGIDVRWVVIDGDEAFFKITKRLHNRLHGAAGGNGGLGRNRSRPLPVSHRTKTPWHWSTGSTRAMW